VSPSSPAPRLGLTTLDQRAVTAFASGSTSELVEEARALAEALAGDGGDFARVRLLARALAAARTQERVLESLLGGCLAKRDEQGVDLIQKVLYGVTRRVTMLCRELERESTARRRPVVIIGHAESVQVGGAK
jgi:hypothetical protein